MRQQHKADQIMPTSAAALSRCRPHVVAAKWKFFLIFVSMLQPIFIPKRLLTAAEVHQVRVLVLSGLGARAELMEP